MRKLKFIELPYPPSVNHYWIYRVVKSRVFCCIGSKGQAFRREVIALCKGYDMYVDERLEMTIDVYCPDRRKRDLDNPTKAILDALEKAGIYYDDSQIDHLIIRRQEVVKGGKIKIYLGSL